MTVHLPHELEQFVLTSVTKGLFASEDEAITQAVRLLQQQELKKTNEPTANFVPAWKRTLEAMKSVPDEVFAALPTDGAEQVDHYIYGTPKRPST